MRESEGQAPMAISTGEQMRFSGWVRWKEIQIPALQTTIYLCDFG